MLLACCLLLVVLPQGQLQFGLTTFSCTQTWAVQGLYAQIASLSLASDGSRVAMGEFASWDGFNNSTNNLIDFNVQPLAVWFASLGLQPYAPFEVRASSAGNRVVVGLPGGGVQVLDGVYGSVSWQFPAYPGLPFKGRDSVLFDLSRDGKYVVILILGSPVSKPNTLYVFQAGSRQMVWSYTFPGSIGNYTSGHALSVSSDGSRVAAILGHTLFMFSGTDNRTLWSDTIQNPVTADYGNIQFSQTGVLLTNDGTHLFTINGQNMTIFSASTGSVANFVKLDSALESNFGSTWEDAFSISSDGSTIATVTRQLTIRNVATGNSIFYKSSLSPATSQHSSSSPVSVSLSQDSNTVAVGSDENEFFVFDRAGDEMCRATVPGGYGGTTNVRVSDDGQTVVAFDSPTISTFKITAQTNWLLIVIGGIIAAGGVVIVSLFMWRRQRRRVENQPPSETSPTTLKPHN
jgi:PQQ-like domain